MTGPQGWAAPDDVPGAPPAPPGPQPPVPGAVPPPPPGPPPAGQSDWAAPPGWGGPQQAPAPGWNAPPGAQQGWGAPQDPRQEWGGAPGWATALPEVKPGVVPLRPLGLGELLDGAVTLVRRYPRPTLGLSAGIALITTLLNIPVLIQVFDSPLLDPAAFSPGEGTLDLDGEIGGLFAGLGASSLLSLLGSVVMAGVITAVVGRGVLGEPMTLRQAWTAVRPRLGALLLLALVVLLAVWGTVVGGLLLAVLLGVVLGGAGVALGVLVFLGAAVLAAYLYVRLSLAPSAMVLERAGLGASLRRSGALVKGDGWRVAGILLLVLVITTFLSQVLQTPFAFRSFSAGFSGETAEFGTADVLLQSVGAALALTVVAPFGAAVRALLYVDRRMRAEGLDVALAAASTPSSSSSA